MTTGRVNVLQSEESWTISEVFHSVSDRVKVSSGSPQFTLRYSLEVICPFKLQLVTFMKNNFHIYIQTVVHETDDLWTSSARSAPKGAYILPCGNSSPLLSLMRGRQQRSGGMKQLLSTCTHTQNFAMFIMLNFWRVCLHGRLISRLHGCTEKTRWRSWW